MSAVPTVRKDPCAENKHYDHAQQQNADDTCQEDAFADYGAGIKGHFCAQFSIDGVGALALQGDLVPQGNI